MSDVFIVTPQTTVEDVEDRIALVQTLNASLDEDADDFKQRSAEFVAELDDLYKTLERIQDPNAHTSRPHTPINQSYGPAVPGSGGSLSLPSRDAVRPRHADRGLQSTSMSGWTLNSSSSGPASNKRTRESFSAGHADAQKRSRKNSATSSLSNSSVSTPASVDSISRAEQEIESSYKTQPRPVDVLKRIREREAQFEARIKAEQEDREYARELSNAGSSFGQSSATSSRPTTQSYFTPDGRFQKPLPPLPPVLYDQPTQYVKSESSTSQHVKFEHHQEPRSLDPQLYRKHSHNTHGLISNEAPGSTSNNAIEIDDDDDSVDDMRLVSSTIRSQSTPNAQYPTLASNPSRSMPNAHNSSGLARPGYVSYGNTVREPKPMPRYVAGAPMAAGSNFYDRAISAFEAAGEVVGGWGQSAVSALGGLAGGFGNPIDLDDAYPGLGIPGSSRDANRGYPLSRLTLEEALAERGLGSMLNDPAQSREDLERLIESIRPDEDIPPEMRLNSPEQLRVPLMEHQKLGLSWLQKQEDSPAKGGILGKNAILYFEFTNSNLP